MYVNEFQSLVNRALVHAHSQLAQSPPINYSQLHKLRVQEHNNPSGSGGKCNVLLLWRNFATAASLLSISASLAPVSSYSNSVVLFSDAKSEI